MERVDNHVRARHGTSSSLLTVPVNSSLHVDCFGAFGILLALRNNFMVSRGLSGSFLWICLRRTTQTPVGTESVLVHIRLLHWQKW